ncbi:MAG: SGNH/GDSL hydrolase family protein [Fuerstiella sp.]|nr:SGNH/GDSL hydrolase family protein [Fuerstiella sp.]
MGLTRTMLDNLVLVIFSVMPLALLFAVRQFLRWNRRTPEARRIRRLIIGNTLIGVFMLSVTIFGGELYYRFFYDETDSFGLTKVTTRWFDRHFQFNASIFRDNIQYDATRVKDRRRVTFVGDSFTAGHGVKNVDDRFANRIRIARPELDIHVAARCGWDTGAQLDFLHRAAETGYEADAVVLVYCLNDVADIVPEWQTVAHRIYEAPKPGFFVQHSFLLNTLHYRVRSLREPDIGNYYSFVRQGYTGTLWQYHRERMLAMRDIVESMGGTFLVVTFPFLHALDEEYEYRNHHDQLDLLWKELNVPHLDLLPVFEPYSPEIVVVSPYDAHPNEFAHGLAEVAILDFLETQLFTDDRE